jgi:hypothetical protein
MIAPEGYVPLSLMWEQLDEFIANRIGSRRHRDNESYSNETVQDEMAQLLMSFTEYKLFAAPKFGVALKISDWPLKVNCPSELSFESNPIPKVKIDRKLSQKYNFCDEFSHDDKKLIFTVMHGKSTKEMFEKARSIMNRKGGLTRPFLFLEFPKFVVNFALFDFLIEHSRSFSEKTKSFADEYRGLNKYILCVQDQTFEDWEQYLKSYRSALQRESGKDNGFIAVGNEEDLLSSNNDGPGRPTKLPMYELATQKLYPDGIPDDVSNYALKKRLRDSGFEISVRSICRYRRSIGS